jgi:hypothetical protein
MLDARSPDRTPAERGLPWREYAKMEDNTLNIDRQARVAERAYDRYLARGGQDGQDLDDWLEAEREVAAENTDIQEPSDASVSARMDSSVPETIARQDPDAAEREAAFERPATSPPRRVRSSNNARTAAPTHP